MIDGDGTDPVGAGVRRAVAGVLGLAPADLADGDGLRAGTWSSWQHLPVLAAVADRFGFALDAGLVRDLTTVGALTTYCGTRAGRPSRAPHEEGDR